MSLYVKKAGILTTVQDLGRDGYRRFGVNPGGVMDRTAVRIVNILLGNPENEPVLEIHFPGPELLFEGPVVFAIGGAVLGPLLNDKPVDNWRVLKAVEGDTLRFSALRAGNRAYLAVKGELSADEWLGSRSTNLAARIGGFRGRSLRLGDRIEFREPGGTVPVSSSLWASSRILPRYSRFPTVRVIRGREFDFLPAYSQQRFVSDQFKVSGDSDRMGYRLIGPPIETGAIPQMISSAVDFGTIQVLPDGSLIILMAEHQTSGGYPRLAHVISVDLPLLAQLGPGDKVAFHEVSIDTAEALRGELERELKQLSVGVRLQLISAKA